MKELTPRNMIEDAKGKYMERNGRREKLPMVKAIFR